VLERTAAGIVSETLFPVRFVPMIRGEGDAPARPVAPADD